MTAADLRDFMVMSHDRPTGSGWWKNEEFMVSTRLQKEKLNVLRIDVIKVTLTESSFYWRFCFFNQPLGPSIFMG